MAFPTIPTVAADRILATINTAGGATKTFPNLSDLTKDPGDLLIAIAIIYDGNSTNNEFSSWGGGFTEFGDFATTTGVSIGCAYKYSTGSETGTFTVTTADASTSDSVLLLLSIPGAHASTPPEAGGYVTATAAAANPGSFNPTGWDNEETLWIAVAGCGETSTSGSFTGIASGPTNYTDYVDTGISADVVGGIEAALAFRQLAAASEDPGAFSNDTSSTRVGSIVIAVRPAVPQATSVAEVSLASHATPSERTNHLITVRARTTSGSTGVIKAALYEGSTNRSGDLTSSALTNSLTDKSLSIPDASAANITDYSNLSIKFWGYDSAGRALTFEVAEVSLKLPLAAGPETYYGVTATQLTFVKSVSARRTTFGQTITALTFVKNISAKRLTFGQIISPFTFVKAVSGRRSTFGQIAASFTFVKAVVATKKTFGQIVAPFTFVKSLAGHKTTFGQISEAFTFSKSVLGFRTVFGQITKSIVATITTAGIQSSNIFGQIVAPFTFVKSFAGHKTTFGQIVAPFIFTKAVTGIRTTFGQLTTPFIFSKSVTGRRTTFSRVDLPLMFVDQISGWKETFGQIVFPSNITFDVVAEVQGIRFGQISMDLVLDKNVAGTKKTFGQSMSSYLFDRSTNGQRTTFGQVLAPFEFVKEFIGQKTTFGQIDLPLNASILVAGRRGISGQIEMSLVLGEQTLGQRKTFGQVLTPFTFDSEVTGLLEVFGAINFPVDFNVDLNTGQVTAHSSLALELLLGLETAGIIRSTNIILNLARAIYLGSTSVDAVYTNSQKVWSK
jgi:hypothetical protein